MPSPPKYDRRTIWQMAFVDGLTPKEIAERLGIPDFRQVQKILRERAAAVIAPERKRRSN